MLSAVVDTNVLVSGLLKGRATRPILEAFQDQKFRLVVSPFLIEEFLRVTSRPMLQPYVSTRERQAIAWYLQTQAYLVIPRVGSRRAAIPKTTSSWKQRLPVRPMPSSPETKIS